MKKVELFASFCFFVLLIAAIYMVTTFYVCDNGQCVAFQRALEAGEPGSYEYNIELLSGFYHDGMWPLPFIAASIIAAIAIWFLDIPITIKNFGVLLFVSFAIIYFVFLFFGHHFVVLIGKEMIRIMREERDLELLQGAVTEVVQ